MRLPVKDRHEVFALCSFIFFDLNAEIAAVFRYTIEPIEQHPLIFGASDRIWIDLRIAKQVKRRLIEAKSLGAVLCLWTWVTVLCQDMGDTSVGSGGDTCGLRLSGEL